MKEDHKQGLLVDVILLKQVLYFPFFYYINHTIRFEHHQRRRFVTEPNKILLPLSHLKCNIFLFWLSIKNETFLKMKITLSLFFHLSYFTLSSLTHKSTLHKILCLFPNVSF